MLVPKIVFENIENEKLKKIFIEKFNELNEPVEIDVFGSSTEDDVIYCQAVTYDFMYSELKRYIEPTEKEIDEFFNDVKKLIEKQKNEIVLYVLSWIFGVNDYITLKNKEQKFIAEISIHGKKELFDAENPKLLTESLIERIIDTFNKEYELKGTLEEIDYRIGDDYTIVVYSDDYSFYYRAPDFNSYIPGLEPIMEKYRNSIIAPARIITELCDQIDKYKRTIE
jgi:hypothetical protein